jgi:hypothetical protein
VIARTQPGTDQLPLCIAERYQPIGSGEQLLAETARLRASTAEAEQPGTSVRYLGSAFVPEDETCFLLFEGSEAVEVERLLEQAGIVCQRLVHAVYLPAESGPLAPRPLLP